MEELIKNLTKAQKAMSHASASATNPHFKSKYVPYEALMDYVKDFLNDNGIYIQQVSHEAEGGVCVETVLHGHGASLSSGKVYVRAEKQTPQGYGSAMTYARRYSLSLATGAGADKDDDANQAEADHKTAKAPATKPAQKQPPATAPSGQYALKKGEAVLVVADTPDAFLGQCRELLSKPDTPECQEIYKSSKPAVTKALADASGETATGLANLMKVYGG